MGTSRSTRLVAVLLLCTGVILSGTAIAQDADADAEAAMRRLQIDSSAQTTLERLFKERSNSKELYEQAVGYAVFTATKAGFIVSGGSGTGVAYKKSSGQRTYMRMGTGGIGFGIGAQRYDLIILFENESILDRFVQGGWDSSATAQAAAGQEGVSVRSSFIDGVAFFQLTEKGLMAHADVSGTRFWVIDDLN